jgi:hypothetical protein
MPDQVQPEARHPTHEPAGAPYFCQCAACWVVEAVDSQEINRSRGRISRVKIRLGIDSGSGVDAQGRGWGDADGICDDWRQLGPSSAASGCIGGSGCALPRHGEGMMMMFQNSYLFMTTTIFGMDFKRYLFMSVTLPENGAGY